MDGLLPEVKAVFTVPTIVAVIFRTFYPDTGGGSLVHAAYVLLSKRAEQE